MARPRILDRRLMEKIAKKIGRKNITAVNRIVSRTAARLRIAAEAALVVVAEKHGIGTSTYQRSLDADKQSQIREALAASGSQRGRASGKKTADVRIVRVLPNKTLTLRSAVETLIQDPELRERCQNDLMAKAHFDKPVNQATLILEERIRNKAKPAQRLVGESLVNYAFHENLSKTRLKVATTDPDDQRGFTQILRGFVPAFRNKTHHFIIKDLSREEALRVCGFVDVLLRVVDNSTNNYEKEKSFNSGSNA